MRTRSPAARATLALLLTVMALSGCANALDSDAARAALEDRARDSVLSRSELPGANTVGRALQESDDAATRAAQLDSLTR